LLGLPAGEVTAVGLDIDPTTFNIRGRVEIVSYPERLLTRLSVQQTAVGETLERSEQQRHAVFQRLVEQRGLRAQLRSGSLLTGQLYVAFDYYPNAPKAMIDWSQETPELPVIPSTLPDVEAKLSNIVAKLDKLPLEAIGDDLRNMLVTLNQTLKDTGKVVNRFDGVGPEAKLTLEGLRRTIASADGMLKSTDATLVGKDASVQQELRDALQEIARAARSLRLLTDFLERHPESLLRGKSKEKP
jgi:paraquat-inducible protein B